MDALQTIRESLVEVTQDDNYTPDIQKDAGLLVSSLDQIKNGTTEALTQLHKAITLELLHRASDPIGMLVVAQKMSVALAECMSLIIDAEAANEEGERSDKAF